MADGMSLLRSLAETQKQAVDTVGRCEDLAAQLAAAQADLAEWERHGIKLPHWMDRKKMAQALERADGTSWFNALARILLASVRAENSEDRGA